LPRIKGGQPVFEFCNRRKRAWGIIKIQQPKNLPGWVGEFHPNQVLRTPLQESDGLGRDRPLYIDDSLMSLVPTRGDMFICHIRSPGRVLGRLKGDRVNPRFLEKEEIKRETGIEDT
jgi:hypothetical protein